MAGRPTKYTEALEEKAGEYLNEYRELGHIIPSVVGLCKFIEVARSTIYEWAKDESRPVFSDILAQIDESQELDLLNGGLGGTMNPTVTKMVLTKHGYSDSVKQDISSTDGTMSPVGFNDFYEEE